MHSFPWWRGGELVVTFDPMFPADSRSGADPDALLDDIRGVGLPLDDSGGQAAPGHPVR